MCAFVEPGKSRCITYADVTLELQAPFRPGDSFWCSQGGRSPVGRTHSFQGDLFALDLASASPSSGVTIISPVDGTFLDTNGISLTEGSELLYDLTLGVAEGRIPKYDVVDRLRQLACDREDR